MPSARAFSLASAKKRGERAAASVDREGGGGVVAGGEQRRPEERLARVAAPAHEPLDVRLHLVAAGVTVILLLNPPRSIAVSAVITFVSDAIGRRIRSPRAARTRPLAASIATNDVREDRLLGAAAECGGPGLAGDEGGQECEYEEKAPEPHRAIVPGPSGHLPPGFSWRRNALPRCRLKPGTAVSASRGRAPSGRA